MFQKQQQNNNERQKYNTTEVMARECASEGGEEDGIDNYMQGVCVRVCMCVYVL
jgi:SUMO ligase MMS21 Smc5/6 complex component